jgi:N4-gp56 family major capsid protein
MATEYTWALDAASGTFKNHALSADVRFAALAKSKFQTFVKPEPGYGKKKGDTITIPRIKNLTEPSSGTFNERDRVPVDTFSMSTVAITVSYYGRAVEFSDMSQLLSSFDLKDAIQKKLRAQMTLTLDTAAAAAFKTAKISFAPTSLANGTFDTDGTPSTTATQNLTVAHLQVIRDYMMDTIHVPGYQGGDDFYCLAATKACRGIRRDPDFIEAHKYSGPDYLVNGEIGKVENIHIIEVNHTNALSGTKGTGNVLGEAVIFGDDAVAMAVAQDPELRVAIPGEYGTQHGIAWIGLLAYGLIWDTSNDGEARVIYVTSA